MWGRVGSHTGDPMIPLRPYQQAAIDRLLARKDKRLLLAHATGAGKTRTSIEIAKALRANTLLVIGSALSRGTWVHEVSRWWPQATMHGIIWGRNNKSLTKKQEAAREAAYNSPFQVVTYSLVKDLDTEPRSLVVLDEAHSLRDPLSQQSDLVKTYLHAHPGVPALALTATPIPNEVVNIWNPVDTLFPNYLGRPHSSGDVPWRFKERYCLRKEGYEGHPVFHGANPETLPELAAKLAPVMHRVSSAEVAQYTPKLNASILWCDDIKRTDKHIVMDWLLERNEDGSHHIGLFAWTHEKAADLAASARLFGWDDVVVITGLLAAEERIAALKAAAERPRVCIVGTAASLADAVSLSFVKQALVFQWQGTPGQAIQFVGRFARQDSVTMEPTFLQYVARTEDEAKARKLRSRLDATTALYTQDSSALELRELMAAPALDDARLQTLCDNMFSETRTSLLEGEDHGTEETE